LSDSVLPVFNEPAQCLKSLLGDPIMTHGLCSRRARKGHEALGEVNVKDVQGFSTIKSVVDAEVQGKSLLCAAPALAAARVVRKNSSADRREGRV